MSKATLRQEIARDSFARGAGFELLFGKIASKRTTVTFDRF